MVTTRGFDDQGWRRANEIHSISRRTTGTLIQELGDLEHQVK